MTSLTFLGHILDGAQSNNIDDRRTAKPPKLRSFGFGEDDNEVSLDVRGPNGHTGGTLTDPQAIRKFRRDGAYYGPQGLQLHSIPHH